MSIKRELQHQMMDVEKRQHLGTYYRLADVLTTMICGKLCKLDDISTIHKWANSKPAQKFLSEQLGIHQIPCRAQLYNVLASVDPNNFNCAFLRWMQYVVGDRDDKTISFDGKTVCSTNKLSADGTPLHIVSAIISDNNLVIGSLEGDTKISERDAFRELIGPLDVSGSMIVADALHCDKKSAEKGGKNQTSGIIIYHPHR